MKSIDKYHFWWAVGLSFTGVILLFISLFLPIKGEIATSVITSAGMVFTFSGTIVGINGNINTKLAKFQTELNDRDKRETQTEKESV